MRIPRAMIWPTVTFDTTRPDEMAAAEEWVDSLTDHGETSDVVGTLLEAAAAARTSTTYETPSNWPPPEPGTHAGSHCTHWTEAGEHCCQCSQIVPAEAWGQEWCPRTANRKEST